MNLFDNFVKYCTLNHLETPRRRDPEATIQKTSQYVTDVIKKIVGPHQEKINKILHRSNQT